MYDNKVEQQRRLLRRWLALAQVICTGADDPSGAVSLLPMAT
jgi:hypothetical protein